MSLSDDHELQVQGYLRFAKLKREQHVREIATTIKDFRTERISAGEVYSTDDVKKLFEALESDMKTLVEQEIAHAYQTNALVVRLLLQQSQNYGVELQVDTTQLENEFLLKQVKASEQTALSRPASDFVRKNTQLSKIGTVASVNVQDPQLLKERDALKAEVQAMKDRMQALQEQTTSMMRDKTMLANEVNQLKDELNNKGSANAATSAQVTQLQKDLANLSANAAGKASLTSAEAGELQKQINQASGEAEKYKRELAACQKKLAEQEKLVKQGEDVLNGKLQESKQFLQMKQMMQTKSQEVVTLRKKLEKYEPQSVPSADAE